MVSGPRAAMAPRMDLDRWMDGWLDRGGPTRREAHSLIDQGATRRSGRGVIGWPTTPLYWASTQSAARVAELSADLFRVVLVHPGIPYICASPEKCRAEGGVPLNTSRQWTVEVSRNFDDFLLRSNRCPNGWARRPLLGSICRRGRRCPPRKIFLAFSRSNQAHAAFRSRPAKSDQFADCHAAAESTQSCTRCSR